VKICKVDGCSKKHSAKGYCRNHYQQFRRKGHTDPVPRHVTKSPTTIVDKNNLSDQEPGLLHPHDRSYYRNMWLKVQGYTCAVCGVADDAYNHGHGGVYGLWRLSVDTSCCSPTRVCCVRGTVCYQCSSALREFSRDSSLTPSHSINGLGITAWTAAATDFLKYDADRSTDGRLTQ
jgi:hypothetical protein